MLSPDLLDSTLRIVVATLVGVVLGLNRDLHGKPTGVRTLGLVSLGSALVTVATLDFARQYGAFDAHVDALSRVLQGLVQGVLTGIGFIGAGVILRGTGKDRIRGLTTAATVWTTAIVGLVCGLGEWAIVLVGVIVMLILLLFGGAFERYVRLHFGHETPDVIPPPPPAA